tara:strand:- start:5621 stop:6598 length:978 start_codon:yes stop_codon:yes gene_type:complete
MSERKINVTLLAGGVGGAKMAEGFSLVPGVSLNIVANIADDDRFHGLWVSPDVDTIIYTLSGNINASQGWGVKGDTYKSLSVLKKFKNKVWMNLGDYDFGLHIYRTDLLNKGFPLSEVTKKIAKYFKIKSKILLPTDDCVQTKILSDQGWLSFQEYFVRDKCSPLIRDIKFEGIEKAVPNEESLKAIYNADILVFAPSNPIVSISPILGVKGISEAINSSKAIKIAVSPLIKGEAVKGPAKEMMDFSGFDQNAFGVAKFYSNYIDILFIDNIDQSLNASIENLGVKAICSKILMTDQESKKNLANQITLLLQHYKNIKKYSAENI